MCSAPTGTGPRFEVVASIGSTNTELARLGAAEGWPHLSVLLARKQTAGKGRGGRTWTSAGIDALTFSVLIRPGLARERWGWLPLLVGAAVVRVLRADASDPDRLALKWPNDIIDVDGATAAIPGWGTHRKVGGLLVETLADGSGAVAGIGLNLAGGERPVPWAGTLQGAGLGSEALVAPEELARRIVAEFDALLQALEAGTDPAAIVEPLCATIGADVDAELPSGDRVHGAAAGLASDGALLIERDGRRTPVHAGDVRVRDPQR